MKRAAKKEAKETKEDKTKDYEETNEEKEDKTKDYEETQEETKAIQIYNTKVMKIENHPRYLEKTKQRKIQEALNELNKTLSKLKKIV